MKKMFFCLMTACMLLTFTPIQLHASSIEPTSLPAPMAAEPANSNDPGVLLLRLDEIKSMDKSNLNSLEKKALRKEVKSINQSLSTIGGGVYLSAGAIVLIVILLIVLL
jgi:hypothetical protein